uniref:Uncharacterized protein n=1 Tax=Burkholderia cenocepacia TaxID=95486 RepID=A0A071M655_9BURK
MYPAVGVSDRGFLAPISTSSRWRARTDLSDAMLVRIFDSYFHYWQRVANATWPILELSPRCCRQYAAGFGETVKTVNSPFDAGKGGLDFFS